MSGPTGEARWPSCPQAERLARQRSASLDPFEEDPRSGRIDKPEDSQGTVSKRTKRKHDKLIKLNKKTKRNDIKHNANVLSLNIPAGAVRAQRRKKNKLFFIYFSFQGDIYIQNSSCSVHMAHPAGKEKKKLDCVVLCKGYGLWSAVDTQHSTAHRYQTWTRLSLCLVISIAAAKGLVNSRPNREEEKEAQDKEREKYGEYNSRNKWWFTSPIYNSV